MILDVLTNAKLYKSLHPLFLEGFEWIQKNTVTATAAGRHELSGGMYALVQMYESKPLDGATFEAHQNYIDIQYIVSGEETIYYAPLERLIAEEYQPEKDYQPLSGAGTALEMKAGDFAIFFPGDAHLPGRTSATGSAGVKKMVVKVPVG